MESSLISAEVESPVVTLQHSVAGHLPLDTVPVQQGGKIGVRLSVNTPSPSGECSSFQTKSSVNLHSLRSSDFYENQTFSEVV